MQKNKIGFLTGIVGSTGTGKSCIVKSMIESLSNICVFDIQEEYGLKGLHEYYKENIIPTKFSVIPAYYDRLKFVRIVELSKGFTFVLEGSTGYIDNDFFKSKDGKRLISCIVAKRHYQKEGGGGNNYILVFHSVASIPKSLWPFIDFFFLFPTSEKNFESNEELINRAHEEVSRNVEIPYKDFKISDYRVVVRTPHGLKNLHYIANYTGKRIV